MKKRDYIKLKKMNNKELLLKELEETRFLIKQAYFKLNLYEEKALVESAILELRSLEIRYGYLLEKYKEEEEKECYM